MGANTVCILKRLKTRFVDLFVFPEDKIEKNTQLRFSCRAHEVADDVS